MTEFKNTERELHHFRVRLTVVALFAFLCFGCLLARFLWLQTYRYNHYAAQAEDNRISVLPVVPNRGLIVDRNGVVLARNFSAYTLELTPSQIKGDIDEVID
jgi:penicillin-binding protein 2